MNADEYDDELPPIIVHSSTRELPNFSMPSAEVIASQRAIEEECENELKLLDMQTNCQISTAVILHSDSSSSEGEASLTAAVNALGVQQQANSILLPEIYMIISELVKHVTNDNANFLQNYLEVLKINNHNVEKVTDEIMLSIKRILLANDQTWTKIDNTVLILWLSALAICKESIKSRMQIKNMLLLLINNITHENQLFEIAHMLRLSIDAKMCLELSDFFRCNISLCNKLSGILLRSSMWDLLHERDSQNLIEEYVPLSTLSCSELSSWLLHGWKNVDTQVHHACVVACGRVIMNDSNEADALLSLLTTLAQPQPNQKHRPDVLKVLVGISKLQLLFGTKTVNK